MFWKWERRRRGRAAVQKEAGAPDLAAWARAALGFEPDEAQARVLAWRGQRGILCCTRQWGKSTVAAVMALHRVATRPGALVLVVSPSERQSLEFLRKARCFAERLGWKARGDGQNRGSLLAPGGGRIVGLPATAATVRGFSKVSLAVVDEAAWVPDDLYRSVRPMLAVGDGDLWLLSTPFGQRGFFYEAWAKGSERWGRFQVKGAECARIPAAFLEEEREELGEEWFRQEYCCEFVAGESQWFERAMVEAAVSGSVKPMFRGMRP